MERSATSALTINAAMLDDAQSIAQSALTTVRDLSHLLHLAMLDDLGLLAAIDWYMAGCGKRHGIRAELLHDGLDQRLVPEIDTAVCRVVQEVMTNVATHADATAGVVRIARLDYILRVTVEDDGSGFDPASAKRGPGMIGIRERIARFQGKTTVDTRTSGGTRLIIELPPVSRQIPRRLVDVIDPVQSMQNPEVLLG